MFAHTFQTRNTLTILHFFGLLNVSVLLCHQCIDKQKQGKQKPSKYFATNC